jgi:hypothetical protein
MLCISALMIQNAVVSEGEVLDLVAFLNASDSLTIPVTFREGTATSKQKAKCMRALTA